MHEQTYLGLPLEEALQRLTALGITPAVTLSSDPRRLANTGELRVVRQNSDGSELTACAFRTCLEDAL